MKSKPVHESFNVQRKNLGMRNGTTNLLGNFVAVNMVFLGPLEDILMRVGVETTTFTTTSEQRCLGWG